MKTLVYAFFIAIILVIKIAGPSSADLNPQKLRAFQLDGSKVLQGFKVSRAGRSTLDPLSDKPAEAVATLNMRCFRGPSEISYSVILFASDEAFRTWDAKMKRSAPAWVSPLARPNKNGVRGSVLGGIRSRVAPPRAVYVNRILIRVAAHQHQEMLRRNPVGSRRALSDSQLNARMRKVKEELVRRARAERTASLIRNP